MISIRDAALGAAILTMLLAPAFDALSRSREAPVSKLTFRTSYESPLVSWWSDGNGCFFAYEGPERERMEMGHVIWLDIVERCDI